MPSEKDIKAVAAASRPYTDETPMTGSGARLCAEDMVLRAVIEIMEQDRPGSRERVRQRASDLIQNAKPDGPEGEQFAERVEAGIRSITGEVIF